MPENYVEPETASLEEAQTPTDAQNIEGNTDNNRKVLRQGVLYILRDGKRYNAQGQVVE